MDSENQVLAALLNFRDISEMKSLDQLLVEAKVDYQQLLERTKGASGS